MLARLFAVVRTFMHMWRAAKQVAEADLLIEFRIEVVFAFEAFWFKYSHTAKAAGGLAPDRLASLNRSGFALFDLLSELSHKGRCYVHI